MEDEKEEKRKHNDEREIVRMKNIEEDKEGNQSAMRERKGKGNGVRKGMERWKQDPMIPNGKKMELSYITSALNMGFLTRTPLSAKLSIGFNFPLVSKSQ